MKKQALLFIAAIFAVCTTALAQEEQDVVEAIITIEESKIDKKAPKVKQGWNFGPLPAVSYNSDLGFQYGALCDIFFYGRNEANVFPEYRHKFNVEVSRYTKGSGVYHLFYDSKYLIPNIRLTFAATYTTAKLYQFYGFNGFASPYDNDFAKANPAYYGVDRSMLRILADFQGKITSHLGWAAGVSYWKYATDHVKIKKYTEEETLWDLYTQGDNPIIPLHQQKGGAQVEFKAGLVYDTRDHEPEPTKGFCAELIAFGSPDFVQKKDPYLNLSVHFRHFVPIVKDRLTLAYHLAYQGTVAGESPFYVKQTISTLYLRQIQTEGLGGRTTVRGILLNRMIGNGYAWANVEFRLRIVNFRFLRQDWHFAINPFFDMGAITQEYRKAEMIAANEPGATEIYNQTKDWLHMSAGIGAKLVMNRNFIVGLEWGKPFDSRDGKNGMNIGLNYIF